MKIPKKFKLLNFDIKIEYDEKLSELSDNWGTCKFRENKLTLTTCKTIDPKHIEQTFCHELIHVILDYMNENDLSKNEKFVDIFSQLLYQAIDTMEY